MYLALGGVALLALGLLYAGGRDGWWEERQGGQVLVTQLGGVLLAAVALSGLWEYVGKRNFANEILEIVNVGSDVSRAGVVRITDQYIQDVEWASYFDNVKERLDIVVAYGRTWRRAHWAHLKRIAAIKKARIRVILPDPDDVESLTVLAARFGRSPKTLKDDILEAASEFATLRRDGGATVEIYFRKGDQVFSCYRLDGTAILTLYSHSRERQTAIPTFVCRTGGNLFQFVYDELQAMLTLSRRADDLELSPPEKRADDDVNDT